MLHVQRIAGLVGVDERQVVRLGRRQRAEGLVRVAEPQLNRSQRRLLANRRDFYPTAKNAAV